MFLWYLSSNAFQCRNQKIETGKSPRTSISCTKMAALTSCHTPDKHKILQQMHSAKYILSLLWTLFCLILIAHIS